jgi:lipopolysaccharide export system protein LptA
MKQFKISTISGHKIFTIVLCLLAVFIVSQVFQSPAWASSGRHERQLLKAAQPGSHAKHVNRITPQIPKANRFQKNKVFLENSDILSADENVSRDYQVLRGNVKFRRGNMFMYCDSAYFYDKTSSLDAFGHVHMTQGDTLNVYADIMHYFGEDEVAQLRYNVRMENRNMTLLTDSLDYEVRSNVGYYFNHGTIVDSKNNTELSSQFGRYELDTKKAEFSTDVKLINDKYEMNTNLLDYNTATHVATIVDETVIVSDSSTIHTNSGWYNTVSDDASLFNRSQIDAKDGKTLVGDTVHYNRVNGNGEAYGNVILNDPKHKVILDGDYGKHNEQTHESFVTKHARAREFSQKDTLFLHGDTLRTFIDKDSNRILTASPQVRFFRSDVQGVCDSLSFTQRDSILNMYKHAVVWSDTRQISGEEINVHIKDSTADWATLPNYGFMAEHLGDEYFNQLSGKKMKAYFVNKELRQLDVNGNVLVLMYPMEKDSTYNKVVSSESSFLKVLLKPKQEVEKISMWPDVSGKVTPLFVAKRSDLYLAGFNWYEGIRPKTPNDIFDISAEMKKMLSTPETKHHRRTVSSK